MSEPESTVMLQMVINRLEQLSRDLSDMQDTLKEIIELGRGIEQEPDGSLA